MQTILSILKPVADIIVTLILWTYFTIGFVLFFSPFYALAMLFPANREGRIQKLNHVFYKGMFRLLQAVTPGLEINIHENIPTIRSSVIVSNHRSYLDPILLISLFPKHKTIVKSVFFRVPIFRQVIQAAGYIPSSGEGAFSSAILSSIEGMDDFLKTGGNLFIFPEGTRRKESGTGTFNKGAFRIAKRCRVPIVVIVIRNTDRLFTPGRFFFNTCIHNRIEIDYIEKILPDYDDPAFSLKKFMTRIRDTMEKSIS